MNPQAKQKGFSKRNGFHQGNNNFILREYIRRNSFTSIVTVSCKYHIIFLIINYLLIAFKQQYADDKKNQFVKLG